MSEVALGATYWTRARELEVRNTLTATIALVPHLNTSVTLVKPVSFANRTCSYYFSEYQSHKNSWPTQVTLSGITASFKCHLPQPRITYKDSLYWRITQVMLAYGHIYERLSWLLIDVGWPSPPWAVPFYRQRVQSCMRQGKAKRKLAASMNSFHSIFDCGYDMFSFLSLCLYFLKTTDCGLHFKADKPFLHLDSFVSELLYHSNRNKKWGHQEIYNMCCRPGTG